MAIFGLVTKKDLSKMGNLCIMALMGIILTSLANMFFIHSSGLEMGILYLGVLIFVGLTAYDTQRIKQRAAQCPQDSEVSLAMFGALMLYLDFINLFLKLLRILGKAKD